MGVDESRLRVKHEGEVTQVEFVDRNILDEGFIQQIGHEIDDLIQCSETPKLLLSFSNVDHLSSAALGTLITIHQKVKEKGGQLRLSDIDPQIHEVFIITKLDKLFEIHDDVDGAMASFA
ncbi:MAG: hypothetical protein Tsb0013_00560 [Phycisphaerales bacterium]